MIQIRIDITSDKQGVSIVVDGAATEKRSNKRERAFRDFLLRALDAASRVLPSATSTGFCKDNEEANVRLGIIKDFDSLQ